jgi:hypothetical protein
MAAFAFALMYMSSVGGCVVLVLRGHPWFAAALLLLILANRLTYDP